MSSAFTSVALAGAVGLLAFSLPAHAVQTIDLGKESGTVSIVPLLGAGSATVLTLASGSPPAPVSFSNLDVGLTGTNSTGNDLAGSALLVSTAYGYSTYLVSETGLTLKSPGEFSFQGGSLFLTGRQTLTETAYLDTADDAYGGFASGTSGTLLGTASFNSTNCQFGSCSDQFHLTDNVALSTPFSVTEVFTIDNPHGSANGVNGQIEVLMAPENPTPGGTPGVPEASTWVMMAIGLAGLGFAGYSRSRQARAIVA